MLNLPVSSFNKDEIYTFIIGIATGSAWFLYFQKNNLISETAGLSGPVFLLTLLCSTGAIYIVYFILCWVVIIISKKKIKKQNDDEELRKMNLTKYLSFFWSGPLEESKVTSHILGLMTVSMGFLYHPLLFFISPSTFLAFVIIQVVYSAVTIVVYVEFSWAWHYLQQVNDFLAKNYCDTLDQKTYIHERACFYAKVRNDESLRQWGEMALREANEGLKNPVADLTKG